jgi:hypothetical protein
MNVSPPSMPRLEATGKTPAKTLGRNVKRIFQLLDTVVTVTSFSEKAAVQAFTGIPPEVYTLARESYNLGKKLSVKYLMLLLAPTIKSVSKGRIQL